MSQLLSISSNLHNGGVLPNPQLNVIHLSDEERSRGDEEGGPVHVHRGSDRKDKPLRKKGDNNRDLTHLETLGSTRLLVMHLKDTGRAAALGSFVFDKYHKGVLT